MQLNNPFQQRLEQKKVEEEKPKENPFQKRSQELEKQSSSLWNGLMDLVFSKEETPFEQGLGQTIRSAGSAIAGTPGNIYQGIKTLSENVPERFQTPEWSKSKPTFVEKGVKNLLEKLPTTENLEEKFDIVTEGKYKPKTESERLAQEITSDFSSLLFPIGKSQGFLKPLTVAIGSNLAKEGVKELGMEETGQNLTKIISMMMIGMFNPNGARKYATNLYQKAESSFPQNANINAKNYISNIESFEKQLEKGLQTIPSKSPVISALKEMKDNVKDGKIEIKNLLEIKRNLNEQRGIKIYDPELRGNKKVKTELKKNYNKAAKIIDNAIEEYGKSNPEFLKNFEMANQAWGGIEQSKKVSDYIMRNLKGHKLKAGSALLLETIFAPATLPTTVGIGLGGTALLKSGELIHRIMKNPTLRNYYFNVLINASKENANGVLKNFNSLSEKLEN